MQAIVMYLAAVWAVLLELSPWLLLGTAVAAVLHVVLPPGFVRRQLRGRFGVLKAVAIGVPLPLCSCGVIPAGLSLRKSGASAGASVGFLISTPQTGVDSILVSASFLGWPFALFKVLSAAVLGWVGGVTTDAIASESAEDLLEGTTPAPPRRTWRDGVAHGLELLRTIWRWLAVGVFVSAALTAFIPTGTLALSSPGGELFAMLVVLLVSVPLYVCATASVPIAAALVAAGLPVGAALVFLMAGPATNVATLGAVHRAFGGRTLGVYLGTIVFGSVGLGWLFDVVAGSTSWVAHTASHHGSSAVAIASSVALLALMAFFGLHEWRSFWRGSRGSSRGAGPSSSKTPVEVGSATCSKCEDHSTKASAPSFDPR